MSDYYEQPPSTAASALGGAASGAWKGVILGALVPALVVGGLAAWALGGFGVIPAAAAVAAFVFGGATGALYGGALGGLLGANSGVDRAKRTQAKYMARAQEEARTQEHADLVRAGIQTRQMEAEAQLHQAVALSEMLKAQKEGKFPVNEQLTALAGKEMNMDAAAMEAPAMQAGMPDTKIDAATIAADMQALAEAPQKELQA